MGIIHARIYQKLPLVELAAICEYDDQRRAAAEVEFGCRTYKDFRELLMESSIDEVSNL